MAKVEVAKAEVEKAEAVRASVVGRGKAAATVVGVRTAGLVGRGEAAAVMDLEVWVTVVAVATAQETSVVGARARETSVEEEMGAAAGMALELTVMAVEVVTAQEMLVVDVMVAMAEAVMAVGA